MWELDHKEGRGPKNWRFWLRCWRRLLRVPWPARRSNQSILKEINPEYSTERTDAEAEAPILRTPDEKNRLIGKDPDAGKDWRQENRVTEDEMVGWHHHLNGNKFKQTLGDSEGQRSLVCCSLWGPKELDMTATEPPQQTPMKQSLPILRFLQPYHHHL